MLIRLLFKGRNFSRRPHAFFRHNLAGQSLSPLLVPFCHLQSKDNLLRRGAPTSPSPWPPGLSPSPRPTWATGWGRGGKAPSQHVGRKQDEGNLPILLNLKEKLGETPGPRARVHPQDHPLAGVPVLSRLPPASPSPQHPAGLARHDGPPRCPRGTRGQQGQGRAPGQQMGPPGR